MGSPIQIFTDLGSLSSPRNFSQSATSFFASNRQGIHQMPFSFLDSHYAYIRYYSYIPVCSPFCSLHTHICFLNSFFYSRIRVSICNLLHIWLIILFKDLLYHNISIIIHSLHFLFTLFQQHLIFPIRISLFPLRVLASSLLVEVNGFEPMTPSLQS